MRSAILSISSRRACLLRPGWSMTSAAMHASARCIHEIAASESFAGGAPSC